MLRFTREGLLFFKRVSNGSYPAKAVLNFKMSHIWQLRVIMVFYIVYILSRQKLPLFSKWQNQKIRFERNDIFRKTHKTGQIMPNTILRHKMNHIQLL